MLRLINGVLQWFLVHPIRLLLRSPLPQRVFSHRIQDERDGTDNNDVGEPQKNPRVHPSERMGKLHPPFFYKQKYVFHFLLHLMRNMEIPRSRPISGGGKDRSE